MSDMYQARTSTASAGFDAGLRQYMLGVYNNMIVGVVISGLVAFAIYTFAFTTDGAGQMGLTQLGVTLYASPLKWVIMFAPLALVFLIAFRVNSMAPATARMLFFLYAGLVGLSLGWIGAVYAATSIAKVFFISAAMFGALSLWGYTTKRSLSGMGQFMIMGVFGLIIASIVNIFMQSAALDWAISIIGVVVFAGLTAYNTQNVKEAYYATGGVGEAAERYAILGALNLYISFLNMFMFLLQIFGGSQE